MSEGNSYESASPGGRKSGSGGRTLVAILVLLAAVVVFAAVFYFVGGMGYLKTALAPKPAATPSAATVAEEAPLIKEEDRDFARRMYVQQIESHEVMDQLAAGNCSGIVITRVQTKDDSATASLIATFRDGTYSPGMMALLRRSDLWYMYSLRGMRPVPGTSQSGSVAGFKQMEASRTIESIAAQEGISTYDQGIIDTLMAEQIKNQKFIKGALDGTYNAIDFGAPVPGQGTETLPVVVTGPNNVKVDGEAVIVKKTIDGRPLNFLVTLSLK